jgi:hypothetical protein
MEPRWAEENLQVIRTLMERSAVYRRALAPVMTVSGAIGIVAAIITCFGFIRSNFAFALFWTGIGVVALSAAFLLVRWQAVRENESFWSPPTRRVAQAFFPGFLAGLAASLFFLWPGLAPENSAWSLPPLWMVFYGCGVHAAGFFMQRGIRLWGWLFVGTGILLAFASFSLDFLQSTEAAHYLMGTFFGVLHLAYGFYLYFTEKRKRAA